MDVSILLSIIHNLVFAEFKSRDNILPNAPSSDPRPKHGADNICKSTKTYSYRNKLLA